MSPGCPDRSVQHETALEPRASLVKFIPAPDLLRECLVAFHIKPKGLKMRDQWIETAVLGDDPKDPAWPNTTAPGISSTRPWRRYPTKVSVGLSPCGRMESIVFLALVPLPAHQGLVLGATATRALERFGDLALGIEPLARQLRRARLDIIDECLDLVLIEAEAPAGFRFTDCSLAGFWAALGLLSMSGPAGCGTAAGALLEGGC